MRIRLLLAVGSAVLLAGCAAQDGARPETPPASAGDAGTCGAEKVARYIGVMPTEAVLAKIKSTSGAQAMRVVGPNDAMTMDFRQDRLTITTGQDGTIKTLRCV